MRNRRDRLTTSRNLGSGLCRRDPPGKDYSSGAVVSQGWTQQRRDEVSEVERSCMV